jgi:hypothetical protein
LPPRAGIKQLAPFAGAENFRGFGICTLLSIVDNHRCGVNRPDAKISLCGALEVMFTRSRFLRILRVLGG